MACEAHREELEMLASILEEGVLSYELAASPARDAQLFPLLPSATPATDTASSASASSLRTSPHASSLSAPAPSPAATATTDATSAPSLSSSSSYPLSHAPRSAALPPSLLNAASSSAPALPPALAPTTRGQARVEPHLDCPVPLRVFHPSIPSDKTHLLTALPPILLDFVLPADYPAAAPPAFTLSCVWLTKAQLEVLSRSLAAAWRDVQGEMVLFRWASLLRDDALQELGYHPSAAAPLVLAHVQPHEYEEAVRAVVGYDTRARQRQFDRASFPCGVCLTEKSGRDCFRFATCGHVFCRVCCAEYYTREIADGAVRALKCPSFECEVKATPGEVRELVDKETFDMYDAQLLQLSLNEMKDMVRCPRQKCQVQVLLEKGSNMGRCWSCGFCFCALCQRAWHGVSSCAVEALHKVVEAYRQCDEEGRALLEAKHGRAALQRMLAEYDSMQFLKAETKPCPSCGANIIKSDGCNKVICSQCRAPFCWLCGRRINSKDPYEHFWSGSCGGALFRGVDVAGDFFVEEG